MFRALMFLMSRSPHSAIVMSSSRRRISSARAHFARSIDARRAGIETIYQDLALAGNLGISANIFMGREAKRKYLGGVVHTLDETFDERGIPESPGYPGHSLR